MKTIPQLITHECTDTATTAVSTAIFIVNVAQPVPSWSSSFTCSCHGPPFLLPNQPTVSKHQHLCTYCIR